MPPKIWHNCQKILEPAKCNLYVEGSTWEAEIAQNIIGGNLDFPKIKKEVSSDARKCTKIQKQCILGKQKYTAKLFVAFT